MQKQAEVTKPKINKNTEALLQNRNQRLLAQEEARQQKLREQQLAKDNVQLKPSDKFLIQKFNREFDQIRDEISASVDNQQVGMPEE